MGTNFYVLNIKAPDKQGRHIGKRSVAGLYCWDCKVTLCRAGEGAIHTGCNHLILGCRCKWYSKCPQCGEAPRKEDVCTSSYGRELGFNRGGFKEKTGVSSCSSFTWALYPSRIKNIQAVVDEYGSIYTRAEFDKVLLECPIQFTHSVGKIFC